MVCIYSVRSVIVKCTYNYHLLLGTHESQKYHLHFPEPSEEQNSTLCITLQVSVSTDHIQHVRPGNMWNTLKHMHIRPGRKVSGLYSVGALHH